MNQSKVKVANKALFIDRDGTINRDCPYCHDPADLRIYEDSVDLMKKYQDDGYLIVVITNQSGVNRGYFTKEELERFNDELVSRLEKSGVTVDAVYYCPHRPDENCNCRKPKTGMVEQASEDLDIDLRSSIVIGDRDDMDGQLARNLKMEYRIINRK